MQKEDKILKPLGDYPPVLTVSEVQDILRISRNAAYRLIGSGALPSFKVGRSVRVLKCDLLVYTKESCYNAHTTLCELPVMEKEVYHASNG